MGTNKAYIKAISYYLPEQLLSNEDYFQKFPEARENKNLEKLGIEKRHIVHPGETASDLAVKSALKLFEEHSIDRSEIDFVLFCAQEFDHYTPTTACLIQERLGLKQSCGAFDFNLGCSGFVYGLSIAKGFIEACGCKNVLLLTSSTLTKTFHPKDKNSHYIFGDAAAATLISTSNEQGIDQFIFGTDGKRGDRIIIKDGGARNPITEESLVDVADEFGNITNNAHFYMNGTGIFNFGLKVVPEMIKEVLAKNNKTLDMIDHVVLHQTNEFMNESIRKKVQIPEAKFINHIKDCGNTVSSSIPIALYESMHSGKIKKGENALLAAFGTGLSWAATIVQL